ncbi:MAG: T9SS type A sorting domain-containing protein [Melioribacteraceae bacterium]|nr:T9SS type A sorting domain-containing protein [Melioribacteraceae bacterium]
MKRLIISFIFFLISFSLVNAQFDKSAFTKNSLKRNDKNYKSTTATNDYKDNTYFNINNINTWHFNNNITDNNGGFHFPNYVGSPVAIYQSGFIWGGKIDGNIHVGGSAYLTGLQPGKIKDDGTPEDPYLEVNRIWRVRPDYRTGDLSKELQSGEGTPEEIRAEYQYCWENWPVDRGAPFQDMNGNNTWEPQFDIPGVPYASQTIWYVANDLNSTLTNQLYGSAPMGIELQVTIWGFADQTALNNTTFRKFTVINKNPDHKSFTDLYFSLWSDPDLGNSGDDYVGCDPTLNLGYAYNGDGYDEGGYNEYPPAIGYKLLQGPIVYSADDNDQGFYNGMWQPNTLNVPMNAFYFFLNSVQGFNDPTQGNYNGTVSFYNLLQGINGDGNAFIDPNTSQPTLYPLSGDPYLGTGWIEENSFQPGDRRMGVPTGPITFHWGEQQDIVYAIIASEPDHMFSSPSVMAFNKANVNSVQNQMSGEAYRLVINKLKKDAQTVQKFYYDNVILTLEGPGLIGDFAPAQILSHFKSLSNGETVASSEWYFTSRPNGSNATLSNFSDGSVSLQTDIEGYYTITQKVNTSLGKEVFAEITLFATSNKFPLPDFTYAPNEVTWGDYVYCDANPSTDPDNDPLSFSWYAQALESFTYDNNKLFKFIPHSVGEFDISLTVKDQFYTENIIKRVKVNPLMDNIENDFSATFPEWQGGRRSTFLKDNTLFAVPEGGDKIFVYEITATSVNKLKEIPLPGAQGIANYINNKLYVWVDANDIYGYYFMSAGHLSIYDVSGDWVLTPLKENYKISDDVMVIQYWSNDYVLINEYGNVFKVYKVDLFTDPSNPQIIASYDLPNDKIRTRAAVVGDKYWLGRRDNNYNHIIDVFSLSNFSLLKTISLGQDNSIWININNSNPDVLVVGKSNNVELFRVNHDLSITNIKNLTVSTPFELQDPNQWNNFGNYTASFISPRILAINKYAGTEYLDFDTGAQVGFHYASYYSNQTSPSLIDDQLVLLPGNMATEFVKLKFSEPLPPIVNVTFKVNLNPIKRLGLYDEMNDYFTVSGSFWNWGIYEMMHETEGDGIFQFTSLMYGNRSYKYSYLFEKQGVPDGIWEKSPIRELTLGSTDVVLDTVFFENMHTPNNGNWLQYLKYYKQDDWAKAYLFFGEYDDATNDEDAIFGENYFPFAPDDTLSDVRFTYPHKEGGTKNDFRAIADDRNVWNIRINSTSQMFPFIIEWNKDVLPPGNFILQDPSARFINVNMRYFDKVELYNSDIKDLQIVYDKGDITHLKISDLSGISKGIDFGILENATNETDITLGENPLPPLPPDGVLDARFKIPGTTDYTVSDFRPYSSNNYEWEFSFKPGASGYPMKVQWDVTTLPSGDIVITSNDNSINIDMKTQDSVMVTNTAITSLKITLNSGGNFATIPLKAGWNIVSVPLLTSDMTHSTLFPNATANGWAYNNGYSAVSTYQTGIGYWVRYGAAENINITGDPVNSTSIIVAAGWNLIGPYDKETVISSLTTLPADNLSSNFFGYDNGYNMPSKLSPGYGYWIRAKQAGTINLNYAPPKTGAIYATGFEINKDWGRISVSDSKNNSKVLYLADGNVGSNFDLPPTPPDGVFDVRWDSDRFVESIKSNELILNSVSFPIQLRAENIDLIIKDKTSGSIIGKLAKNSPPITINEIAFNRLLIEPLEMPISYQLMQNYPNPFNPATIIKYGIPERSNVKITIFNSIGEVIETLTNEIKEPGFYEAKWNAASFASGVYFYRITTDHFTDIKKMILVK